MIKLKEYRHECKSGYEVCVCVYSVWLVKWMCSYSYAKTNRWEVTCSFVYSSYWLFFFFLRVCLMWEPYGDIQCKHSGDRTHQISVQALILLFVRFCVVTFGKIFCSKLIKNAKCASFFKFIFLLITPLTFSLSSASFPTFPFRYPGLMTWSPSLSLSTGYCRRAGLPTLNPRQNSTKTASPECFYSWRKCYICPLTPFLSHLPCLWLDSLYARP